MFLVQSVICDEGKLNKQSRDLFVEFRGRCEFSHGLRTKHFSRLRFARQTPKTSFLIISLYPFFLITHAISEYRNKPENNIYKAFEKK